MQEFYGTSTTNYHTVFKDKNRLLQAIALNNDVSKEENGKWLKDSTEVALVEYAFDKNFNRGDLEKIYPRIAELPFDSKRKCMTTIHQISTP